MSDNDTDSLWLLSQSGIRTVKEARLISQRSLRCDLNNFMSKCGSSSRRTYEDVQVSVWRRIRRLASIKLSDVMYCIMVCMDYPKSVTTSFLSKINKNSLTSVTMISIHIYKKTFLAAAEIESNITGSKDSSILKMMLSKI